jgi:hypothetical protein
LYTVFAPEIMAFGAVRGLALRLSYTSKTGHGVAPRALSELCYVIATNFFWGGSVMIKFLALAAAAAAHLGIPYTPPTTPIDNALARVQLSAGLPGEVTKPHVHLTNRVMIYFQAGTNTIRYPGGKVSPEHFKPGKVQWNDAMGPHTATITASGPVDIVHVELKSPPGMMPVVKPAARDPRAVDPAHFKVEMENNQVRVLRLRLGKGEKTQMYDERLERLLVPLTDTRLKTASAGGISKGAQYRRGEVHWLMPGTQSDENAGDGPCEMIVVEFKK